MRFSAIVVAAGAGVRAGAGPPKQWRPLGGSPVVRWSVEAFLAAGADALVVVAPPGDEARARDALAGLEGWRLATGGATRALSVQAGLVALGADASEAVLIHDAARPFASSAPIAALVNALEDADGAIPVLPVADTLKRGNADGVTTVDRQDLWRAQTPQAFRVAAIRDAYARWEGDEIPTDDAAVVERAGGRIALVPGDAMLFKLTHPEDFAMAERLAASHRVTRVGHGYDVHAFAPGDAVWLCGVRIAHTHALAGHSDADAGLHAVTDALLGAIGAGDIGDHFPPTDPRWKGATSDQFVTHAMALLAARGAVVANLDVTLVCEAPKIKPHREAMRARLAGLLGVTIDQVSVKATTTEGLGLTGRKEGLAAQAIVAVEAPAADEPAATTRAAG